MISKTFSNIIDCMFSLDEEYLIKLFADALKRLNEQNICKEKKITYKYNPVTLEDKETNKQIHVETQNSCADMTVIGSQLKELDSLHKASTMLFMHYALNVSFEENQYDIHIRTRTISPKEYIQSHFPDITFEEAYEEYMKLQNDLKQEDI